MSALPLVDTRLLDQSERDVSISLETLVRTKDACGWLVTIAEASTGPEAELVARWLDNLGEHAYARMLQLQMMRRDLLVMQ